MEGVIQLHGAKQMLVGESIRQIESDKYIPGDTVYLRDDGSSYLVKRKPQAAIGVKYEGFVYMPTFGPTCKFRPVLDSPGRHVLWLAKL